LWKKKKNLLEILQIKKLFVEEFLFHYFFSLSHLAISATMSFDLDGGGQDGPPVPKLGLQADGSVVADENDFCFQFIRR
jgi:hypothetical protein